MYVYSGRVESSCLFVCLMLMLLMMNWEDDIVTLVTLIYMFASINKPPSPEVYIPACNLSRIQASKLPFESPGPHQ